MILNSSSHYEHLFESMNHVCYEKVWDCVLSFNFSIFLNRVKRNSEDDFEIFMFFLHISSFHIFVFAKELVTRKNLVSAIVNSVLEFIHKFLIIIILFQILLMMNQILLVSLINFFEKLHFFLSTFAMIMHFLSIQKS